jgi:hypothetical protein
MRNLLDVLRPDVLDETGRFSVRVTLIAADDEFRQILHDVTEVATLETRDRLWALADRAGLAA